MMIMKVMLILLSALTHASSFRAKMVQDLELSSADSTEGSGAQVFQASSNSEMMPADATELSRTTASTQGSVCCLCAGVVQNYFVTTNSWYAADKSVCGTKEGCPSDTFAFEARRAGADPGQGQLTSDTDCEAEANIGIQAATTHGKPSGRAGEALQAGVVYDRKYGVVTPIDDQIRVAIKAIKPTITLEIHTGPGNGALRSVAEATLRWMDAPEPMKNDFLGAYMSDDEQTRLMLGRMNEDTDKIMFNVYFPGGSGSHPADFTVRMSELPKHSDANTLLAALHPCLTSPQKGTEFRSWDETLSVDCS